MKKLLALTLVGSSLFLGCISIKAEEYDAFGINYSGDASIGNNIYGINTADGTKTLLTTKVFDSNSWSAGTSYVSSTTGEIMIRGGGSNYHAYNWKTNIWRDVTVDNSGMTMFEKPTSFGVDSSTVQIGSDTNDVDITAEGLSIDGDPVISKKANGELHIGKNSWITKEENGRQKVWAKDAAGNSIPIDYTNGTKLLINGRDVEQSINNVGALFLNRTLTDEGFEKTFALNHLGPFMLTTSLLELLNSNKYSRIINVSSAAHFNVVSDSLKNSSYKRSFIESLFFKTYLNKNDYQSKKMDYKGGHQYSRTKLMNILFTYKLARQLKKENTTINCLHPGFVASKFGHNNKGFFKSFLKFGQRIKAISIEDGALCSTYLALSDQVKNISGRYFDEDTKEIQSSSMSHNKSLQNDLWRKSEQYINMI
mgnify:CR=1 FL=1